jgi:phosphoglucosamine mutase
MGKFFGTDGIRGIAFTELTEDLVERVSLATASLFGGNNTTLLVGRDTRKSGLAFENAICRGFKAEGWDALSVGIIPAPGISYLCKTRKAYGVVISASHNPAEYNGIKFFSPNGHKLTDEEENEIESRINGYDLKSEDVSCSRDDSLQNNYTNELINAFDLDLSGMTVVIDCAFGATYRIAPETLKKLGAEVIEHGTLADGDMINVDCGATHPEMVSNMVRDNPGVIAGFSFDGDGDRCIACDELGNTVDGDKIMGIISRSMKSQNRLNKNIVVSTVMSNGGLADYLNRHGMTMERSKVGDRYVWKRMLESDAYLGGEQSGHVIIRDRATTGDGLVTALSLLESIDVLKNNLSALSKEIPTYPQLLINVKVKDKNTVLDSGIIDELHLWADEQFNGNGRILIRPSGTEPKIRVMSESPSLDECKRVCEHTANRIRENFGI